MGNFVSEDQILLYKKFVFGIREDLGRYVTLHIPGPKVKCPNCIFDPVNRRSAGMFKADNPYPANMPGPTPFTGGICPVCNGTGQYTTETTKIVQALIRWLKVDQKKYLIQGLELENDFRIKCDIQYLNDFKSARYVVIDGTPAEVTTIVKKGLRDLIQIVVFLKRSEWGPGQQKDVTKF